MTASAANGKVINDIVDYAQTDLGARFRNSEADQVEVDQATLEALIEKVQAQGYVIVPDVIPPAECEAIKSDANGAFVHMGGRNNFEGFATQRLYGLFNHTLRCNPWIEQPLAIALTEHFLEPAPLLSQAQIINIHPGEQAQPPHVDDYFYRWPRPRPPLGAATIFALDEFTESNGATVVYPGSHLWDERLPKPEDSAVKAVMPQGSMLFFLGTTWHHGGANESDAARMCLTAQYCSPWLRQQENYSLSIPPETVAKCSPRIQQMLGYSIHSPFMGMVSGMHPLRLLPEQPSW